MASAIPILWMLWTGTPALPPEPRKCAYIRPDPQREPNRGDRRRFRRKRRT